MGNKIHFKDIDNYEEWYKYDKNGKLTYKKSSTGQEEWHEYDEKGNEIHSKDSMGSERWFEYEYYPNGNLKTQTYYTAYR